jgi:hypothetical protein
MKHYTPTTPRAAIAIAAASIAITTLVALVGAPTVMDVHEAATSMARTRGAVVVQIARSDFRVAGEMYARANALPADDVR